VASWVTGWSNRASPGKKRRPQGLWGATLRGCDRSQRTRRAKYFLLAYLLSRISNRIGWELREIKAALMVTSAKFPGGHLSADHRGQIV
jgi:hypothetical protein